MSSLEEEILGVAVVDDDPIFRELICATVARKSKFAIFEASSGKDLFDILSTQHVDCIILDYDLGQESGLAVMQRIDEAYPEAPPIIMMTGGGRESTAIRAFRMGVSDYLPKSGLKPEHLVTSVIKVVERDRQESVAKKEHKRLVAASGVDVVTGLEGRTLLDERLNQLALLPLVSRTCYALIMVEFVEYQSVKERFGLKTADRALRAFGKRLHELARSNDICGRYAEGTFLVIADFASGPEDLDALRRRLADNLFLCLNFDLANISTSPCIAALRCPDTVEPDRPGASFLLDSVGALLAETKLAGVSFGNVQDGLAVVSPLDGSLYRLSNPTPRVNGSAHSARPAADELRGTDRRREFRQRVFKRGLIHLLDTKATASCAVRNISAHGAGLRIDAVFSVPDTFDLEIIGSGERLRVQVRWQTGVNLGVQFVEVVAGQRAV